MNVLIVDDEELGRRALATMLKEYCPEIGCISSATSASDARESIVRYAPDLLFLDIEMPGENGFDLLDSIHPAHRLFSVIFVTAFDHYALRAIKANALDFLLKPVDIDQLRESIRKVSTARGRQPGMAGSFDDRIGLLLESLASGKIPDRIALPSSQGLRVIHTAEIVRCEADNYYCTIVLSGGERILIVKSFKEFESELSGPDFIRVHKSHLVNLEHVREYLRQPDSYNGGYLVMNNGDKVEISRRRKEQVLEKLRGKLYMSQTK
jgi:two-component system LytT family response regulator